MLPDDVNLQKRLNCIPTSFSLCSDSCSDDKIVHGRGLPRLVYKWANDSVVQKENRYFHEGFLKGRLVAKSPKSVFNPFNFKSFCIYFNFRFFGTRQ